MVSDQIWAQWTTVWNAARNGALLLANDRFRWSDLFRGRYIWYRPSFMAEMLVAFNSCDNALIQKTIRLTVFIHGKLWKKYFAENKLFLQWISEITLIHGMKTWKYEKCFVHADWGGFLSIFGFNFIIYHYLIKSSQNIRCIRQNTRFQKTVPNVERYQK